MEKRKWTNIKAVETEIIKMRKAGRTRQEIADTLGLEKVQIKNWITAGLSAAHRKEVRPRIKYHIVYLHRNEYPVSVMCKFFGVSRRSIGMKTCSTGTSTQTGQGVLYLSMIRDLYDNSIVAYKTAASQTISLVLDTIRLAVNRQKIKTFQQANQLIVGPRVQDGNSSVLQKGNHCLFQFQGGMIVSDCNFHFTYSLTHRKG